MNKRVLVAPLNWGLGHATRCIPVIKEFLKQGAEVFIASDGRSLELLKKEYPELKFFELSGYNIKYPENGSMVLQMMLQAPKISSAIRREHIELEKVVKQNNIEIIFSDNRYGCYSKNAYSVFMSHQLNIRALGSLRWVEYFLLQKNKNLISKFAECWVPDFKGEENLSGNLSHPSNLKNVKYIGPLSRVNSSENKKQVEEKFDIMIICSGPEPQRTIFEELITEQILKTNLKTVLVRGVTETEKHIKKKNNLKIISSAEAEEMQSLIESSSVIVSRPGYSTIMDLATLGKNAIFISTPGQTEQEYLAKHFMKRNFFYSNSQNNFDLLAALEESKKYSGLKITQQPELLSKAITELLLK